MFKIANFLLVIITFIFISACSADKEEVAPDASPVNTSSSDAPMPKPNAVVKPTVQPVSKPELISFTAEDIKSIDYINIESISSEEYHDSVAPDNDYYSEKFIEAWQGQIKIGTLDEENFMLAIYEGTSIDQDIINSLLIEAFFIRNENSAVFADVNVKVWLINNIFLICLISNGACESLVEDLLSKSNQLNPVSSSYNGIVMHTKGNSTFSARPIPTPVPVFFTNLSINNHTDTQPSWSPDGTKIVFTSDRDRNGEIYVMN